MLNELDMPRGLGKEQLKETYGDRVLDVDEISSIKEERMQFMEQEMGNRELDSPTVFNKILQDYKKYRNKKIDKKKLKKLREDNWH